MQILFSSPTGIIFGNPTAESLIQLQNPITERQEERQLQKDIIDGGCNALRGYSKKIRLGIFRSLDAHRYFS